MPISNRYECYIRNQKINNICFRNPKSYRYSSRHRSLRGHNDSRILTHGQTQQYRTVILPPVYNYIHAGLIDNLIYRSQSR